MPKAAETYAWKYGGESAALYPGDVLTAQQLLEALLLASGADAAYTLATAYGAGLNGFVAQLNATAARMGMTHTHFTSPDGLPYPTEYSTYSTPSDLLTLGLAAMRYPAFRSIVDQGLTTTCAKGPGHHQVRGQHRRPDRLRTPAPWASRPGTPPRRALPAVRGGQERPHADPGWCWTARPPARPPPSGTPEQMLNWGFGLRQQATAGPAAPSRPRRVITGRLRAGRP